jgi:hypothetical protein
MLLILWVKMRRSKPREIVSLNYSKNGYFEGDNQGPHFRKIKVILKNFAQISVFTRRPLQMLTFFRVNGYILYTL